MAQGSSKPTFDLTSFFIVTTSAVAAFLIAYLPAISNPYVINDDVRQQIFWMQQWADPALFQNDLLTEYARHYVPWGVKALYYPFAKIMNPVQFTKVITGILFVITAWLMYRLALNFGDRLTAYIAVAFFVFYAGFMRKISGGLSQSFAFPLLIAYLYFLSLDRIGRAALTALFQAFFNPYIFILSATTQSVYLLYNYTGLLRRSLIRNETTTGPRCKKASLTELLLLNSPILAGFLILGIEFLWGRPAELGNLISGAEAIGKIEYTAVGRYELVPIPSLTYEFIRPWIFNLPYREWGRIPGWITAIMLIAIGIYGLRNRASGIISKKGFRVFGYVFSASLICYWVSCLFFMKLFVPRRYVEFTIYIFYCMGSAVLVRMAMEKLGLGRKSALVTALFLIFAAIRLYHVGQFDYSKHKDLYQFVEISPKSALFSGHPGLMDNIPTFARRKAFVTYKLSHTWVQPYWNTIKQRTYDFFAAYYSSDPQYVINFAEKYQIHYVIVRELDFSLDLIAENQIYFEPFGTYIKNITGDHADFALLDKSKFPPIFEQNGIRVVKLERRFDSFSSNDSK